MIGNFFRRYWPVSKKAKQQAQDQIVFARLQTLLTEHVLTVWDTVSNTPQYQSVTPDAEFDRYYFSSPELHDAPHYRVGVRGFTVCYYPETGRHSLSLHLGTSDRLRLAIAQSLDDAFDDLQRDDGRFVKGFQFLLPDAEHATAKVD